MVSAIQVVNPQPYNPVSDFVPIGRIGEIPMLALVGTESHIKSWADLVSYTKANPGKVNFATAGNGSASHLFTSILHQEFGMNGVFVAYKSTNQALLDVSTNKTDIYLANFPPAAGLISAGKLKPIGVGSTSRLATLPDVPTFAEMLGKPGYRVVLWYGLLAPTGTPPAIVNRLSQELAKAAAAPLLKTRMEAAGGIVSVASGKEMHDQVVSDNTRFASIVKELGLVK
jgi:tripartite-type tricarboxylate transporter receptor subunit TctC